MVVVDKFEEVVDKFEEVEYRLNNTIDSKQKEQSTMSTNAEHNHRENSSLMERKNIEGTPFYMWGDYRGDTPKYYITLVEFL